ncbi:toll/interleukin-1 receptor domain-containing protein [Minwuia thermotolerans]|uniref:Toll/interleukin-1 receptor domain-containing protein n=1 Tax=Minwuia thermotolerans TaxID=2056226 RepID=A0A2M9FV72_9PROT|nr:toll/interleukin-1 receptor domain-containing protein [Minwuia thermotolerans]PJK27378.1 toll/interleukin-1 receptor domain-containing protein [Minwuia thermotolerans]
MKAFISYSHRDSFALERLHVHLASLKREGHIEAWYDRDILAGSELDAEIAEQLEACELFLLLVSPDFLASEYCVETEMRRALERHDAREARVVPIIIEPCDWASSGLRALKTLPRDGKPISDWTNENTAYLNVIQELRRILDHEPPTSAPGSNTAAAPNDDDAIRSAPERRYRVRREFDDIDKAEFRENAFKTIKAYFQSAVQELNSVEGLRGRFTNLSETSFGCVIVNRGLGRGTAHLTVHGGRGQHGFGDIYYSFSENAAENTANGWFNVEADEYELHLKASITLTHNERSMSPEAAAEALWTEILQQAGISYDG